MNTSIYNLTALVGRQLYQLADRMPEDKPEPDIKCDGTIICNNAEGCADQDCLARMIPIEEYADQLKTVKLTRKAE